MTEFDKVRLTRANKREFEQMAATWNVLQNQINSMDEDTLAKLLIWELENKQRIHFLNRIKSRHNRVRDIRERQELFGDVGIKN